MSDTLHSPPPLPNDPAARTATGELKDPALTTQVEKKDETVQPEPKKEEPKKDAPAGPPDKYEFKAPDDWKAKGLELDPAVIDKATPIFKELGLSNDQAQKLVSLYAGLSAEANSANEKASSDRLQTQSDEWKKELKADPEIGGKLDAVKERIGRMYDALPKPVVDAFKSQMEFTGIGDNPAFVRMMSAISEKFSEGRPVNGKGPVEVKLPGQAASAAKSMYPNLA